MTNPEAKDPVRMVVLISQIITGSLIAGPIPILLIGFFIGPLLSPPRPGAPIGEVSDETFKAILGYAAMGVGAMAVLMSFIVPQVIAASGRKSITQNAPACAARG